MTSRTDLVASVPRQCPSPSPLRGLWAGAVCVALLTACPPKNEGEPGSSATETDAVSDSETDPSSTDTTVGDEPSTSVTETSEPPATDSSATDPSDTESSDTESSATESDTEGDTDIPEPPPAECGASDPLVSAAFSFEGAWSNDDEKLTPCTVDAVDVGPDAIVTSLECDDGDGPEAVTVSVAAAPEGSPAWKAGDEVHLRTWELSEIGFNFEYALVELRLSADDSLLLLGLRGEIWKPEAALPIVLGASFPCGPEEDFAEGELTPFQLEFELPGATLGLIQGQRGALAIDAFQAFAIDVEEANTNNCCHYTRWHDFLIRRVNLQ